MYWWWGKFCFGKENCWIRIWNVYLPRTFIQVTLDILVSLATYTFICMLLSKKGSFAFCTLHQKFILVARNSSNKLTSHLLHVCKQTREMWSDYLFLGITSHWSVVAVFWANVISAKKCQRKYMELPLKIIYWYEVTLTRLVFTTSRVCSGQRKPAKSWNLRISFSRPGKSWNLIIIFEPWKSWKIKVLFGSLVTTDDKARIMI